MKKTFLFALLLAAVSPAFSQQLISSTLLGSNTKSELQTKFGLPLIQFGVQYYRITYTTLNLQGVIDTVSGLVAVPDNPSRIYPRVVYQHGTAGDKLGVPSFNILTDGEGQIGKLFAGLGYLALLPDYLGLGVSDGFHPYVHAASEASVAIDMLRATSEFIAQHGVQINDQLFITGYSQGGHAAMALHRELETNLSDEFTVTAAAPMSGPYSIGEVMRSLILSNEVYYYPAYIPNTALSYQTAYGNIFNDLTDIFKPVYAAPIGQFYADSISLSELNDELVGLLIANEGQSIPTKMIRPDVLAAVEANPDHPINVALRANDTYQWAPQKPTRIFYCTADDQVPFENSIVARDSMLARGAVNLTATDVNSTADHGGCVTPALTNTIIFFLGFQQIGTVGTSAPAPAGKPLVVSPNPARDFISLENEIENAALRVTSADGRLIYTELLPVGTQRIDVSGWTNGMYVLQLYTGDSIRTATVLVSH